MAAYCDLWGVCIVHCVRVYCMQCYDCILWPMRRVYHALCEGILYTVLWLHIVTCEACVSCTVWGYTMLSEVTPCTVWGYTVYCIQCYGCILWPVRRVYRALCEGILYAVLWLHIVTYEACVSCTVWGYTVYSVMAAYCDLWSVCIVHCVRVYYVKRSQFSFTYFRMFY